MQHAFFGPQNAREGGLTGIGPLNGTGNMNIYPRSFLGCVLCTLWLAVCAYCLVWAFWQRNANINGEVDLGFTLSMLIFTFPIGYVLGVLASAVIRMLHDTWGIVTPGGFLPNAISWMIFVPAGYFQWFVLVPWLYRRAKRT